MIFYVFSQTRRSGRRKRKGKGPGTKGLNIGGVLNGLSRQLPEISRPDRGVSSPPPFFRFFSSFLFFFFYFFFVLFFLDHTIPRSLYLIYYKQELCLSRNLHVAERHDLLCSSRDRQKPEFQLSRCNNTRPLGILITINFSFPSSKSANFHPD